MTELKDVSAINTEIPLREEPSPDETNISISSYQDGGPGSSLCRKMVRCIFPFFSLFSFTFFMILFNVGIYMYQMGRDSTRNDWVCTLHDMGFKYGPDIRYKYEFQRLIMPIVLHANALHLAYNMFSLMFFGFFVEKFLGTIKTAMLYVMSGIFSYTFASALEPMNVSLGASGAILGLSAFYYYFYITNFSNLSYLDRIGFVFFTMLSIGNLVQPMRLPGEDFDFFSHLGGFIGGGLISSFMYTNDLKGRPIALGQYRLTMFFLTLLAEAGLLGILFTRDVPQLPLCV